MSKVFISYSHRDDHWRMEIIETLTETHPELASLLWDDTTIPPGSDWAQLLEQQRSESVAALLLVSEHYLRSETVADEVRHLLELKERTGLRLIPILLSSCDWKRVPWLKAIQIFPERARPLCDFQKPDIWAALAGLATHLLTVLRIPLKEVRRLVILVHGIRTRAEWQGRIKHLLEANGTTIVEPAGYEFFDVFRFLCPFWTRRRAIQTVLGKIRDALNLHAGKFEEFVILAHSFGTYIVGDILRENPDIKPARLLLCGSILPPSYKWKGLPNRPQVVLNETGSRDIWPILAKSVTWGYGSTGTFGFQSPGVRDRFHNVAHSDYFNGDFVERYWVRWIHHGVLEATAFETSHRPPTPFYKNLLEILPIKYVILFAAALISYGIFIGPKPASHTQSESAATSAVRPGTPVPKEAISMEQTPGLTLRGQLPDPSPPVFAESVEVELTNVFDEAIVSDLRVSWQKLGESQDRLRSEGFPKGAILIDRFAVRLAANGTDSGTCVWTYAPKGPNAAETEEILLRLPQGNSIRPRHRDLSLARNERIRGEITLKEQGLFKVTFFGKLRVREFEHPFTAEFRLFK